ncbi:MAG: FtsX-like permease family protein [Thermomicrobiales bacterium]
MAQRAGLTSRCWCRAAVAYWQLRRYGSPLTCTIWGGWWLRPAAGGRARLGLLAGGGDRAAGWCPRSWPARRRGDAAGGSATAAALGAWQVARRPQRYARAALLLILALGIGLFAAVYSRTWGQSQADQADYQVGADLRVEPSRRFAAPLASYQLPGAYATLPGVQRSMSAVRRREELSRTIGVGDVLLIDSARAAEIVQFRPDLADAPLPDLLARLTAGRPSLATVPIAGEPRRLALDVRATRIPPPVTAPAPSPSPARPSPSAPPVPIAMALVIRDGAGMVYKLPLGNLRADGQVERLIVPLTLPLPGGGSAAPTYPLAVIGMEVSTTAGRVAAQTRFDLVGLRSSAADSGEAWGDVPLERDASRWQAQNSELTAVSVAPSITPATAPADSVYSLVLGTGSTTLPTPYPIAFSVRPSGSALPETLPILVEEDLLTQLGARIGDTLEMSLIGQRRVQIVGTLRGFPTLDPNATTPFVVADLPTVAALGFAPGREIPEPLEEWLTVAPERAATIAETLRRDPFGSPTVLDRAERTAGLRADPLALGTIGALVLGFIAAALVAILGFALSAAIAARERQAEFALLRALGLHPRQLVAWLSLEQGITVGLSLLGGLLLGLLLAWLVLPLVTLTQAGTTAVPATRVTIPWGTVALLVGGVLAVLVGIGAVLGALLRRIGLGGALRVAEE